MEQAITGYEKYFQMGRRAFLAGIKCAPVNDPEFVKGYQNEWAGAKIGDEKSKHASEAAKAWVGGWTLENLKA